MFFYRKIKKKYFQIKSYLIIGQIALRLLLDVKDFVYNKNKSKLKWNIYKDVIYITDCYLEFGIKKKLELNNFNL